MTDPNLSSEDSVLAEAKRSLKDAGRSCKAAKRSSKDELRHPSWQSNPAWGSRLATRTPSAAGTDPSGGRIRKMSGWIVPNTEILGPGNPVCAGPACVTAELSKNPKLTAAIPNGIVRSPNRTNTFPHSYCASPLAQCPRQRTSPDVRGRNMLIAARIVRRTTWVRLGGSTPIRPQIRSTEWAYSHRHLLAILGCCVAQLPSAPGQ